eukprot:3675070-Amphidinium_carterae.1
MPQCHYESAYDGRALERTLMPSIEMLARLQTTSLGEPEPPWSTRRPQSSSRAGYAASVRGNEDRSHKCGSRCEEDELLAESCLEGSLPSS